MDWTTIITSLITVLAVFSGAFLSYYLTQRLNTKNIKFTIWHKNRVESIKEVYGALAGALGSFKSSINARQNGFLNNSPDFGLPNEYNNILRIYLKNSLYFNDEEISTLKEIIIIYEKLLTKQDEDIKLYNDAEKLIDKIRSDYSNIIKVFDAKENKEF